MKTMSIEHPVYRCGTITKKTSFRALLKKRVSDIWLFNSHQLTSKFLKWKKQFNLQNDEAYDQWWAVKGSGNVDCGVDIQTDTLFFEQIKIGNL